MNADKNNRIWDYFVSYSRDDREEFVLPLVNALKKAGLKIWYDEDELELGDSIAESIQKGLANSLAAIAIISNSYIEKEWGKSEIHYFLNKQHIDKTRIIPIWHNVDVEFVMDLLPLLVDRVGTSSSLPIIDIVHRLKLINRQQNNIESFPTISNAGKDLDNKLYSWMLKSNDGIYDSHNKKKILLVDDVPICLKVIALALEPLCCEFGFATNSQQALELLSKENYDLVILDIMMPGETGNITGNRFHINSMDTPYMFLTAVSDFKIKEELEHLSHVGYITKPFDERNLLKRVDDLLKDNGIYSILVRELKIGPINYRLISDAIIDSEQLSYLIDDRSIFAGAILHKIKGVIREFCTKQHQYDTSTNAAKLYNSRMAHLVKLTKRWVQHGGKKNEEVEESITNYLKDVSFLRRNLSYEVKLEEFMLLSQESITFLKLCLMEIIDNAVESTDNVLNIAITGKYLTTMNKYSIVIGNDGPHISELMAKNLFDAGFSTKGANRGLGLNLMKSLAEPYHALVSLHSTCPVEFLIEFIG